MVVAFTATFHEDLLQFVTALCGLEKGPTFL
jgi:hypothetical protein